MNSPLIVEHRQGAVFATLNNPPVNAIANAQVRDLDELLTAIAEDAHTRVLVIQGKGDNFSAGADLKEGMSQENTSAKEIIELRCALFSKIAAFRKPVLAAVDGYCLGGGMELALACHLRIAAESAQFALPEIKLGAAPLWGGVQRCIRTMGQSQALYLLLKGHRISAREALQQGLLNAVVPTEKLQEEVDALALQLAGSSSNAMAAILDVARNASHLPLNKALDYELQTLLPLAGSADNIEGVMAFLEKREPKFSS